MNRQTHEPAIALPKAEIVHVSHDRLYWRMTSTFEMLPADAQKAQAIAGPNPTSFGFYGFESHEIKPGVWVSHWNCNSDSKVQ